MDGDGILYVITDLCYVDNKGPFVVRAEDIGSFVHTYSSTYKEPFYSTDIIVVNFEEKLLWVLFHEGVCWLTKG